MLPSSALRAAFILAFALLTSGCGGGCVIGFSPPLDDLQERYAAGTSQEVELQPYQYDRNKLTVSSDRPDVVRVDRPSEELLRFHFVAPGEATLTVTTVDDLRDQEVTVHEHDRFDVWLLETVYSDALPIAPLDGKSIWVVDSAPVPTQHDIAILYGDADGQLFGGGLAEVSLQEGVTRCIARADLPVDSHCVEFNSVGEHSLGIRVGSEERSVSVQTVDPSDIVDLQLLTDEHYAHGDEDLVRIDAVGLTADDTRVYGMMPNFEAGPIQGRQGNYYRENRGYFVFHPDDGRDPVKLVVKATGFERETEYRGEYEEPINFDDCYGWFAAESTCDVGPFEVQP